MSKLVYRYLSLCCFETPAGFVLKVEDTSLGFLRYIEVTARPLPSLICAQLAMLMYIFGGPHK